MASVLRDFRCVCVQGMAGIYPCWNIHMHSMINFDDQGYANFRPSDR